MTAPLLEEEDVLEGAAPDAVAETKGFESEEIDAVAGLNANWRWLFKLCCTMVKEGDVESIGEPGFQAQIKGLDVEVEEESREQPVPISSLAFPHTPLSRSLSLISIAVCV